MILPPELLLYVAEYLSDDLRALKRFSQCHPDFVPVYDKIVWRHVIVRLRYSWVGRDYDENLARRPDPPKGPKISVNMVNHEDVLKVLPRKAHLVRTLTIRGDVYASRSTRVYAHVIKTILDSTIQLHKANLIMALNDPGERNALVLAGPVLQRGNVDINVHLSIPCPATAGWYPEHNVLAEFGNVADLTLFKDCSGRMYESSLPVLQLPRELKTLHVISDGWTTREYNHLFHQVDHIDKLVLRRMEFIARNTDRVVSIPNAPDVHILTYTTLIFLHLPHTERVTLHGPKTIGRLRFDPLSSESLPNLHTVVLGGDSDWNRHAFSQLTLVSDMCDTVAIQEAAVCIPALAQPRVQNRTKTMIVRLQHVIEDLEKLLLQLIYLLPQLERLYMLVDFECSATPPSGFQEVMGACTTTVQQVFPKHYSPEYDYLYYISGATLNKYRMDALEMYGAAQNGA